jgi:hypothetical protein
MRKQVNDLRVCRHQPCRRRRAAVRMKMLAQRCAKERGIPEEDAEELCECRPAWHASRQ